MGGSGSCGGCGGAMWGKMDIQEKYKGLKVVHGRGKDESHTNIIKQNATPFLWKLAKQYNCKLVQDNHTDREYLYYNK